MFTVNTTDVFEKWVDKLKDRRARSIIHNHIDRMADENLGDHKSVGGGIYEKRINYGPGYRLYYCLKGKTWILLLCGGDKSSQSQDLKKAQAIKKGLK